MKNTLIAAAALLAGAPLFAQSSVTIYGAIDNSLTRLTGNGRSVTGLSSGGGGSIGSKLGFTGTEDLGGGLKAGFKLEMGLLTDNGANGVPGSNNNVAIVPPGGALRFDRAAYVSLAGPFGEVRLGRDLVASFLNDVIYDPFLTYGVGSSLNFPLGVLGSLFNSGTYPLAASTVGKDVSSLFRVSNAIGYSTPGNLGGFSGQIQFAPSEQASNSAAARRDGRVVSGRVAYDQGPISASVSAGKSVQSNGTIRQDVATANVGGAYDFGVIRLLGEYARFKTDSATGVAGQDLTARIVTLGATAPVGPGLVKVGYSRAERSLGGVAGKPRAAKLAVGYDYALSKRTSLFATVARLTNKDGSALNVGDGGVAGLGNAGAFNANQSSTGYDIGFRHSF